MIRSAGFRYDKVVAIATVGPGGVMIYRVPNRSEGPNGDIGEDIHRLIRTASPMKGNVCDEMRMAIEGALTLLWEAS
jgi:hypothetical protein